MIRQDFHIHSVFCDGRDTPEEMVLAGIEKGLTRMGICAHSPLEFDGGYTLTEDRFPEFQAEIKRLKIKYKDRIELLCGIELDYFSEADTSGFDYVIGSVHYVEADGEYFAVDNTRDIVKNGCEKHFGGDWLALTERFFEIAADVADKTDCDIIGHFDLVSIYNIDGELFDEDDPRYLAAWQAAADRLIESGKPFEINTGGTARGHRKVPYPAPKMMEYIKSHGGRFILSSDAHATENIAYQFDKYEHWCK